MDIYGSYAAGLCLPSSDIDLIIVSRNPGLEFNIAGLLENLKSELGKRQWVTQANIVKNAAMSVMRVDCNEEMGNIKIDITVEDSRHKGLECVKFMRSCITCYPPLGHVLYVFKYLLKICNLNETYSVNLDGN